MSDPTSRTTPAASDLHAARNPFLPALAGGLGSGAGFGAGSAAAWFAAQRLAPLPPTPPLRRRPLDMPDADPLDDSTNLQGDPSMAATHQNPAAARGNPHHESNPDEARANPDEARRNPAESVQQNPSKPPTLKYHVDEIVKVRSLGDLPGRITGIASRGASGGFFGGGSKPKYEVQLVTGSPSVADEGSLTRFSNPASAPRRRNPAAERPNPLAEAELLPLDGASLGDDLDDEEGNAEYDDERLAGNPADGGADDDEDGGPAFIHAVAPATSPRLAGAGALALLAGALLAWGALEQRAGR